MLKILKQFLKNNNYFYIMTFLRYFDKKMLKRTFLNIKVIKVKLLLSYNFRFLKLK